MATSSHSSIIGGTSTCAFKTKITTEDAIHRAEEKLQPIDHNMGSKQAAALRFKRK